MIFHVSIYVIYIYTCIQIHIIIVALYFRQVMENIKEGNRKQKSLEPTDIIGDAEVLDIMFVIMHLYCIY
jgi:hypothetical protein